MLRLHRDKKSAGEGPQDSSSNGCCLFRFHHGCVFNPTQTRCKFFRALEMMCSMGSRSCAKIKILKLLHEAFLFKMPEVG